MQISEIAEENEQLLTKLSDQQNLVQEKQELVDQLDQLREDNEINKQTLEYFNNDMIPTMKSQFVILQQQVIGSNQENHKLHVENGILKGNHEQKIEHYQTQNKILEDKIAQLNAEFKTASEDQIQFQNKIEGLSLQLNHKA